MTSLLATTVTLVILLNVAFIIDRLTDHGYAGSPPKLKQKIKSWGHRGKLPY